MLRYSENVKCNLIIYYIMSTLVKNDEGVCEGGVSADCDHMTRKMWDLIPVLDCSQLLKLCPSQCKPSACPITTPGPRTDSPRRTMSGRTHRGPPTPASVTMIPEHGRFGSRQPLRKLPSSQKNAILFNS